MWEWVSAAQAVLLAAAVVLLVRGRERVRALAHAERELARQRAELQLILDTVPAVIFYKDRHHRIVRANRELARLVGLPREAIEGRTDAELNSPHAERYQQDEREIMATGAAKRGIVEPLHTLDGPRWLQTDKVPLPDGRGVVGFAVDITERRRAEEEVRRLAAADARLARLVEGMTEACFMVDVDWRFTFVNDRCEPLFHLGRADMLGRPMFEVFHQLVGTPMEANYRRAMADRAAVSFLALSPVARRWLDVRLFPAGDGLAAFLLDIHDRKGAEDEVRRLNADLEERVRERTAELEAANTQLEAFSYSVSHDLRAPLRAIDGFSRMVMEDHAAAVPPEAADLLARVRTGAERMNRLIDDLMAFARLGRQGVRKQPLDATALVQACLGELGVEALAPRVRVTVDDLPPCHGDPALLRQVWLNLLGNAIKYSARRDPAEIAVTGAATPDGGTSYSVADNGAGFDMRYADRLFSVFRRLHRADEYEGSGVGLAIVRQIVTRHGGTVSAAAEPDRGATFTFTLPSAAAG